MTDLGQILEALLHGTGVPLSTWAVYLVAFALVSLATYFARGLFEYLFPIPNQKKKIAALQKSLIDHMQLAQEARNFGEKAIVQANDKGWLLLQAEGEIRELRTKVAKQAETIAAFRNNRTKKKVKRAPTK